jgi:hypothetical protein
MTDQANIDCMDSLDAEYRRPDVSAGLFGPQRDFVEDDSPLVSAVCSRRAGKTWGVTRKMVKVCQNKKNALVGYITKTRDWAEELVWEPLKNIDAGQGGGADFNNAKLRCVFSNGSKIRLAGAKDKAQAEVLRGFGYDLIVIDECGSIDPVIMRYILRDVLPAALGENEGQLLVVGTPNESCSGYFHDVSTKESSGFSKHHWTQCSPCGLIASPQSVTQSLTHTWPKNAGSGATQRLIPSTCVSLWACGPRMSFCLSSGSLNQTRCIRPTFS